jgi:hypothetical protein
LTTFPDPDPSSLELHLSRAETYVHIGFLRSA